jgi:peroxiredoxin
MADRKTVREGQKVKDFSSKDQNGQDFRLSEFRGEKVLLSFRPLAWTSVCARQMQTLERYKRSLDKLNTVAVGLSADSVPCKTAWAKSLRINKTRLLADFWPHGGVAKSMGLFRKDGFSERANVIADELGRVIFVRVYSLRELPDMKELLRVLEEYKGKE